MRELLWPSMGLLRLARYYAHRIGRLPGTPVYIAMGFGIGVSVSFTPFVGLHILMGTLLCLALRGSFVSMVIGTFLMGNPWTFPFIWLSSYKIGRLMMGKNTGHAKMPMELTWHHLVKKPFELLLPMTIGSLPMVILGGVIGFYIVRKLIVEYRGVKA